MKTFFSTLLTLALLAPAAQGQTDTPAARDDTADPLLFAESFTQPLPRTLTTRLDVRF
jgi:hypothetical protein